MKKDDSLNSLPSTRLTFPPFPCPCCPHDLKKVSAPLPPFTLLFIFSPPSILLRFISLFSAWPAFFPPAPSSPFPRHPFFTSLPFFCVFCPFLSHCSFSCLPLFSPASFLPLSSLLLLHLPFSSFPPSLSAFPPLLPPPMSQGIMVN